MWENYYAEVYGIIYMIDSTEGKKIEEDKDIIPKLLSNKFLNGKPFLIFANKKDIKESISGLEICQYLNIPELAVEHSTFIYYDNISCIPLLNMPKPTLTDMVHSFLNGKNHQPNAKIHISAINPSYESESIEGYIIEPKMEDSNIADKSDILKYGHKDSINYPDILNPFSEIFSKIEPCCSNLTPEVPKNGGINNVFKQNPFEINDIKTKPANFISKVQIRRHHKIGAIDQHLEQIKKVQNPIIFSKKVTNEIAHEYPNETLRQSNERLYAGLNWLFITIETQHYFLQKRVKQDLKSRNNA
ncbi:unnamed protein product [Gordionus sp. m RMFG-2023]|uniref:uncharacterized protein LOC135928358 n=1 Tax=Gordionus sp. m RMFG-2023 TaxID=3053472 RepID=UPI0030E1B8A2